MKQYVERGIYKTVDTPKYDILRETWIYQEIKQEVVSEEHEHFLQAQRELLIEIIEARFPRLLALATSIVSSITEVSALHSLILCISTVRLEKEARQSLSSAGQTEKRE
jgi:predicted transposase YdaD